MLVICMLVNSDYCFSQYLEELLVKARWKKTFWTSTLQIHPHATDHLTSMALVNIRVNLKGIFSGNFSLVIATLNIYI